MKNHEDALPRLKEGDLEKVSGLYKAKTGVGCDGVHPKVPLHLTKETRRKVVEFLEKVEQSGRWPQQACTAVFFLIPKNVTSPRPDVDTLVGSYESFWCGDVAAEISRGLKCHGWSKWRSSTKSLGNIDGDERFSGHAKERRPRNGGIGFGSGTGGLGRRMSASQERSCGYFVCT